MPDAPALAGRPEEAPLPVPYQRGGVRHLPGLPYASLPGARPLELDLYLPASGTPPFPAVVFLHGGGWRVGSRRSAGPAFTEDPQWPFEELVRAGIAVASIDYRLTGEAGWPAQLEDARAALAWLRARADEIGLAPDRVGAWGESAGAHLAALLGLRATVSAVVAWYPPTDLPAIAPALGADPGSAESREALLLGGPVTERPDAARDASPVTHVAPGAPPFLLLHGEADRLMPVDQSRRLHRALQEAGADSELHTYPGADHMWLGTPQVARDALGRTREFLLARL